ncbi:MAG: glycosyltransferase involved in cell wall biosynthesis [Flammeovirgaceae bacterium]|jgi:glycosyltransferase involved in cell wall biosynthesis
MNRILFLYSEIAQYFITCLQALVENYDIEVHLVKWEKNAEAPFEFEIDSRIKLYERSDYNNEELLNLAKSINPALIFSVGWMDKGYVKVCKSYKSKIPVVFGMDNKWNGGLKQQVATLISPFTIQTYFSHAWVAGVPQKKYAEKLGFRNKHVLEGYYSADVDYFSKFYLEKSAQDTFPKRFIYVGRYIPHKGISGLCEAFIALQKEAPNNWELWGLGTGELEGNLPKHSQIKHFGFVQPKDMNSYISQTSVMVLPSHYEPWGVVVHEFATAGFPLICSREVGASTAFLKENKNGFLFNAKNTDELKACLKKIVKMDHGSLKEMSIKSHELGNQITPKKWASTLMALLG